MNLDRKKAVVGELHETERNMAEESILSFHTHPDDGLTNKSAQDILSTYFRLK